MALRAKPRLEAGTGLLQLPHGLRRHWETLGDTGRHWEQRAGAQHHPPSCHAAEGKVKLSPSTRAQRQLPGCPSALTHTGRAPLSFPFIPLDKTRAAKIL